MVAPEANRQCPGPVVAFDFDGTLTVKDSFTDFVAWRAGPLHNFLGLLGLVPELLLYLILRDRGRLKGAVIRVFMAGLSPGELAAEAEAFADARADKMLRPDALAAWRAWRDRGATLVIVSASPEAVIAPFARRLGADRLIATQLALDASGRIAGGLDGANCRGPEKVRRLRAAFSEDLVLAAAYGDTSGDREMLQMAQAPGYRVFKEKP